MELIKCRDKIDNDAIGQYPQEYGEGFKEGSNMYSEGKPYVKLFCEKVTEDLKKIAKNCGLYEGYMEELNSDIRTKIGWR